MRTVALGANHSLAVDGTHALVRIWRRPDLDSATGAHLAVELATAIAGVIPTMRTLALDLRDAPYIGGPESVEALAHLVRACERGNVRVAVILGGDPVQRLQVRRVVTTYALEATRIFEDDRAATEWLAVPDAFVPR
jgi:hypothetical protein